MKYLLLTFVLLFNTGQIQNEVNLTADEYSNKRVCFEENLCEEINENDILTLNEFYWGEED